MGLNRKEFLKIFCIVLLFVGLIVAWLAFGDRGFIHLYRMEKERQAYLERIRILEEENQNLLEQINRLRSDEEYIESEARKELLFTGLTGRRTRQNRDGMEKLQVVKRQRRSSPENN